MKELKILQEFWQSTLDNCSNFPSTLESTGIYLPFFPHALFSCYNLTDDGGFSKLIKSIGAHLKGLTHLQLGFSKYE